MLLGPIIALSYPCGLHGRKETKMQTRVRIATVREVAAFLKVKEETVCNLTLHGKLPGFKLGKSWRFNMDEVERLFAGYPGGGQNHAAGGLGASHISNRAGVSLEERL
jgi:excisionase family DNA binding protein